MSGYGPAFEQQVRDEMQDMQYREDVRAEREDLARTLRRDAGLVLAGYVKHALNEGMIRCDSSVERDLRGLLRRAGAE
jgi:hypothetical protein